MGVGLRLFLVAMTLLATFFAPPTVWADSLYSITDSAAELAIGVDPQEAMVWMNTFPVAAGSDYISSIRVAYGRVGGPSALNGLPVQILLYEDMDGGTPQDAVLKFSLNTVIANANSNTLNAYAIPPTLIQGNLVAAVLYENMTTVSKFIGALDTTAPSFPSRSYVGFAAEIDPADLVSIPPAQWGTMESFGSTGNFRIEAFGIATPEPATACLLALAIAARVQHRRRKNCAVPGYSYCQPKRAARWP